MAVNVAHAAGSAHLASGEIGAVTAKGWLPKGEIPNPNWVKHGQCLREVMRFADLTLEEFAYALGRDRSQIGRQMEGKERPQIELCLAHERFEGPMVIALARRATGVEVDTVVHIRRT